MAPADAKVRHAAWRSNRAMDEISEGNLNIPRERSIMLTLTCLLVAVVALASSTAGASDENVKIPPYEHILVIIAENQGYESIIGNRRAPKINSLANMRGTGLATKFYGEVHPSEGNYVAMIGGDTFGIRDDDAWYCGSDAPDTADTPSRYCSSAVANQRYVNHTVTARNLVDQLAEQNLTWKGYFEDIPSAGSKAVSYPEKHDPVPGKPSGLYVSKHNGFINFKRVQNDPAIASKLVGFDQLFQDLASGQVPNYAHIVPNQCNDMHGLSGANVPHNCRDRAGLISLGDAMIDELVRKIKASPIWTAPGNAAVVVTWDEDDHRTVGAQGCCSCDYSSGMATFGGGHIPTLVILNHPPSDTPRKDDTLYNHYSLLRTVEEAFGIKEYLGHANDFDCGVNPMSRLFQTQ
jgi:phosphatidylinositol-3-phosphatase